MKRIALYLINSFIFLLYYSISFAQTPGVAINADGTSANVLSLLEIKSTTQGILIPRMTTAQRNVIGGGANPIPPGLWVYDTDTKSFWYNIGSATAGNGWVQILTSVATGWLTTGNSGTVDNGAAGNFLGTTDDKPFNIRVNGRASGRLESTTGYRNTFYGYMAGEVISNTFPSNPNAKDNTAIGHLALDNNNNSYNTAIGLLGFAFQYRWVR